MAEPTSVPLPYLPFKIAILFPLAFLAVIWLLFLLEQVTGLSLHQFGVYPHHLSGLIGIFFAPLIHGSLAHIVANSLPVLILGGMLVHTYPRSAKPVVISLYLITGLLVWLFARPAFHFGASGLTYGVMFFIFTIGVIRRDPLPAALSMIVFFLYGSMIYGLFPNEPGVSYESHFFGAITGIVLAVIYRDRDPRQPRKTYDWENADEDEEDPLIGDEWRLK